MSNLTIYHSPINANLMTFFNAFNLGPIKQNTVDFLPGPRAYHLDIFIQCGMFEWLVAQAKLDHAGMRNRACDMKSQVSVAVAEHLFDQSCPYFLFHSHTIGPGTFFNPTAIQVFQDAFEYGIGMVQDTTDGLQLKGFRMIDYRGCQGHLFFIFIAYFAWSWLRLLIVFLISYIFIYTIRGAKSPLQNARLLLFSNIYYRGQTLIMKWTYSIGGNDGNVPGVIFSFHGTHSES